MVKTLLIEDNPGDIDLMREMLEIASEPSYQIEAAQRLADAVVLLAQNRFDLAIIDLGLPDSDGLETLQSVVHLAPGLPVVVLTGNLDEQLGLDAVKQGAQDFLVKGHFSHALLLKSLRYAVERKQMEHALQDSMKQSRIILDAMDNQVLLLDRDKRIIWPNKKACEVSELERAELIGRKCYQIFHSPHDTPKSCPFEAIISQQINQTVESEMEALGRNYIVSCTPIYDQEGNLDKIIHVATDITKRKQLQRELIQAHKMEAIGSLAGGIAHDFNNILSAVIGFTDLAMPRISHDPELKSDLEEVYKAGLRGRDLIRQILTFARHSDQDPEPVRTDILAAEVVRLLRSTIATSIELKTEFNSDAHILANPVKLHQLFINLCSNAAHAMADTGELTIRLDDVNIEKEVSTPMSQLTPGIYQKIEIKDTGSGIPKSIREQIFEPFFTTKDLHEGTGMGLATVLRIVKDCNGSISVNSQEGVGTCFSILIPATTAKAAKPIPQLDEIPTGNETILVVDDEPSICKFAERILEMQGYSVVTETDSRNALSLFTESPAKFDLVITDMSMPKLSGDSLAEEISTINPETPIILVTGYSRQISVERLKEININKMLHKPYERGDLLEAVRTTLDSVK